jgi:FdhD protein
LSARETTKFYQAIRCERGVCQAGSLEFIGEEPLLIRIDEKPYAVVMRTPGEEVFQAAGFCLGEGIADSPDDFMRIEYSEVMGPNVIDILLKPERREKIHGILARKGFVSQTSCGICGKEMIQDIHQTVSPLENSFEISISRLIDCIAKLTNNQKHYQTTRGSHAALILDDRLEAISFAEDVGRHNALDKAIGKAFMTRVLAKACVLVLSSRISYELVQKTARAHLPIVISVSRPTALAVAMGTALNITIAFYDGASEVTVVCGENRIKRE